MKRLIGLIAFLATLLFVLPGHAEEKKARLIPHDQLVTPQQKVLLEARAVLEGFPFSGRPLSGEKVEFSEKGAFLGLTLSGGDGWARREIAPVSRGVHRIRVMLKSPRYEAPEARTIIACWDQQRPLIVVNLRSTVALQKPSPSFPPPFESFPFFQEQEKGPEPLPQAVSVLRDLSKDWTLLFFLPKEDDVLPGIRTWLDRHRFPMTPVFSWPPAEDASEPETALIERIRELKSQGWVNFAYGIGVSRSDAMAFVRHRMRPIIVLTDEEDEEEEDLPKSARTAAGWEQVREIIKK